MKLLIAEDDQVSASMMASILGDIPLKIELAPDGHRALDVIERDAPAVVILDWMLPGPSGIDICRRIRQRNIAERPYVLIVTIRDSDDDVVEAFAAGADDYVTKPVHAGQLRARVNAGLRLVLREHALVQERAALQAALGRLRDMPALVAICSYCRRVNDADEAWLNPERYLMLHAGVQFTHGICPTCAPRLLESRGREDAGAWAEEHF